MDSESGIELEQDPPRPVSGGELNSWRRGFTPQAEIWNGRMAIIGLMGFLAILFISNIILVG